MRQFNFKNSSFNSDLKKQRKNSQTDSIDGQILTSFQMSEKRQLEESLALEQRNLEEGWQTILTIYKLKQEKELILMDSQHSLDYKKLQFKFGNLTRKLQLSHKKNGPSNLQRN